MAIVKRPPESVTRSISFDKPVSELLDDYCKFVDCTPDDYFANFALKKKRYCVTLNTRSGNARRMAQEQRSVRVPAKDPYDSTASPCKKSHRLPVGSGHRNNVVLQVSLS